MGLLSPPPPRARARAAALSVRRQDWNTSAEELQALVDAGVLDASELAEVAPRFHTRPDWMHGLQPGTHGAAARDTHRLRSLRHTAS